MKIIACIIGISFPLIQIFGQDKTANFDTLIIEIESKILIKISNYQTSWLKDIEGFNSITDSLKTKINLIKSDIPKETSYKLIYRTNKNEISIENRPDFIVYNFDNNISKQRINECHISSVEYDIFIYYNQLDELLETDIKSCILLATTHENVNFGKQTDYQLKTNDGIAWTNSCKCEKDTVYFIREGSHYNANKSMLELSPGIGVGVIQNDIVSDFSFRVGRYGTHKGILKRHQYVSYSLVYLFNQDNNFDINQFINFGYRINLSNNLNNYRWMGFEIGYLIYQKGDFLKSPTFRLGSMIDLKNNIHLTPTIFFDNGFKKVYPGLRIGIDIKL